MWEEYAHMMLLLLSDEKSPINQSLSLVHGQAVIIARMFVFNNSFLCQDSVMTNRALRRSGSFWAQRNSMSSD